MICHTVVRTRSPEQGAQPPITLPSLPVQTAGAEPRTPSQGTHTHTLSLLWHRDTSEVCTALITNKSSVN